MEKVLSHFLFTTKKIDEFALNLIALYDLYLPIVGKTSICFYMLLNNYVCCSNKTDCLSLNSQAICQQLHININQLIDAKDKLEAIGLLQTFVSCSNNNAKIYIFVLRTPLQFDHFITNPKLKSLLISSIGSTNFEFLQYKYSHDSQLNNSIEITKNFSSIFNDENLKNIPEIDWNKLYLNIQKTTSLTITIDQTSKQMIQDIYKKYRISIKDIEMTIYDSIYVVDNNNIVDPNLLLQNFNKLLSGNITTTFSPISRNSKIFYGQLDENQEQKIINNYQLVSPPLYLSSIFKRPLDEKEKNIIFLLRTKYHLNDEIINVIIDFSLFKTNGKLNKKYILKTANSINGLGLDQVSEVINHFKKALVNNTKTINDQINYKLESL